MRLKKRCECEKQARCKHPYYTRFKAAGRPYELCTGTADRAAATVEGSRLQIEKRRTGSLPPQRLSKLAAAHIAQAEREYRAGAITQGRVKAISWHWSPVLATLGPDFDPRGLTYEALEEYRDARLKSVRGQTVEREFWVMWQGLRIAKRRGWVRDYALHRDEWPVIGHDAKDAARAGKLHAGEVVTAVLAELDQDWRDRLELAARTALRKHELLRLDFSWLLKAPKGLGCPAALRPPGEKTKDGDDRLIPVTAPALAILKRRHKQIGGGLVFPGDRKKSLYTAIRKARAKAVERYGEAGAEARGYMRNVTLRDLRHAALTAGEQATLDKKAAADFAGHDRLTTTDIYLHSTLPRLVAFAKAAGGAWSGVQKSGKPTTQAPNQQYFPAVSVVGTTGIEPVTPTVSSQGRGSKAAKIRDRARHIGHGKPHTYTAQEGQRGGARK